MAALPRSILRLADLSTRKPTAFELTPDAKDRAAISEALGVQALRKLRFAGALSPVGKTDWALQAELGATVVQPCVITLDPVTTRIDETVVRNYAAELAEIDAAEIEMPEDDSVEPLPASLDISEVMIEALSLALPAFPKSPGAGLDQTTFSEPGVTPMSDDDAKPFAGLADLRNSLNNKGQGDS